MEDLKQDSNETSIRDKMIEIAITLGFHINTLGRLWEEPRYFSEKDVFSVLILQESEITNTLMELYNITEEEYREKVAQYVKEEKMITIKRDTGNENIEFG